MAKQECTLLGNLHPTFPLERISTKDTRRGKRREPYRGDAAATRRRLKREYRDSVGYGSFKSFARGFYTQQEPS